MSHKNRRRMSLVASSTMRPVSSTSAHAVDVRSERPHPGMSVAGRFRIERRIAAGAMGEVWQGVHCELQLRVAIKTLRRDMIANHEVVTRFAREAYLLGRIQSDHVVRVLDFVRDRRLGPVLVTELVDGPSLASMLEARRLNVEEGIDLAVHLLSGLRELHRARVVHRDVKPANILMRPLGDGEHRAVFVDLGVSRLVPDVSRSDECLTEITTADRAVGTVEYMAPEQILSSRNVTAAADLYSVGAILYRAVAGDHAFAEVHGVDLMKRKLSAPAPALRTGRSDRVAKGFEEVVARALAGPPSERYELADEMLADVSLLRDAARRAAKTARSVPPPPPEGTGRTAPTLPPPAAPRRRAGVPVVIATLCALAGLAAGVGVEVAAEHRRHDVGPCTVTQQVQPAPGGGTAFTIVCDRRPE